MKCFYCGKEIDKKSTYIISHNTSNGKQYKRYFCNEEEYEEYKNNKLIRRETLSSLDYIMGYTCTNTYKNKRLSQLVNKYGEKKTYEVIESNKEKLRNLLLKRDMDEIYMINYIMKSLENALNNFHNWNNK